ncbi:MAG: hypothetical protein Q8O05_05505, partial [Chloroflexota bacterium]|nr:hypothetical protein [Chloroflexota bacterium]
MRELVELLLGPEGRRKLMLRRMTNEELFRSYQDELRLKLRNHKNLTDTQKLLAKLRESLGDSPPT